MPKRRFSLETVHPSNEDTRSDTTRKGYHEGRIPFAAGYGPAADGPYTLIEYIGSRGNDNPNLITGIAPLPGIKRVNPKYVRSIVNRKNKVKSYVESLPFSNNYGTPRSRALDRMLNTAVNDMNFDEMYRINKLINPSLTEEQFVKSIQGLINY